MDTSTSTLFSNTACMRGSRTGQKGSDNFPRTLAWFPATCSSGMPLSSFLMVLSGMFFQVSQLAFCIHVNACHPEHILTKQLHKLTTPNREKSLSGFWPYLPLVLFRSFGSKTARQFVYSHRLRY